MNMSIYFYQLIDKFKRMHQLEYTPSVRFNFDDYSNKRDMSAELLFELSCTNQKQTHRSIQFNLCQINLEQQVQLSNPSKLKTQEFLQEFDQNFIVTFEEDPKPVELFSKTGSFGLFGEPIQYKNGNPDVAPIIEDDFYKLDLCLSQNMEPSIINILQKNNTKKQITSAKVRIKSMNIKEKDSPVQFQVKKRTVFKNKENIVSNAQQFKITKKKNTNQNTLDNLLNQPKSCNTSKPKDSRRKNCFTSQLVITKNNKNSQAFPKDNLKLDLKRYSNIFLDHKQARQSFRSTTLDNWKRKFQIQKKTHEQKTAKRENIFQKITIFR